MITKRIKKFMCKTGSIYADGELKIPATVVLVWGFLFLAISGLAIGLVYNLIVEPIKTLGTIVIIFGGLGIFYVMVKGIGFLIPSFILSYFKTLESRLEITCDITFPDEVKNIYTQIEALDENNQGAFMRGIDPLLRKMGEDR